MPLGTGPDAQPLVTHALRGVLSCPDLSDVLVVAPPGHLPELTAAVELAGESPQGVDGRPITITVVPGGAERTDSVAAGLQALPPRVGIVLVHDAARALTPPVVFDRVVTAVRHGHAAVVPGLAVTDTIKAVDLRDQVTSTPDRNTLRAVQTPQGFLRETLERAHADGDGAATDDAGLVEATGGTVLVVEGDPRALKVTNPEDLTRVGTMLHTPATEAMGDATEALADAPAAGKRHRRPLLLVLGGLPGTGKTTLARAWAQAHRAVHVRVDTIEQALLRSGAALAGPEGYAVAYELAADQLRIGLDVVADSVNPLPVTRAAWREAAVAAGADVLEVELTCEPAEHRHRVQTREADIPGHSLPDWAAVQGSDAEPWPEADLRLDTSTTPASELVRLIEDAVHASSGHCAAEPEPSQ